jgi:hypothetical protein
MKRQIVAIKCFCLLFFFLPVYMFSLVFPPEPAFLSDSAALRSRYIDEWLSLPIAQLQTIQPEEYLDERGKEFQVRIEGDNDFLHIIVVPQTKIETDLYSSDGVETIISGEYIVGVPGTWILTRRKSTGVPTNVMYFFAGNSEVNISFRPSGEKTLADFSVYNVFAVKNVTISMRFERLFTASFDEIRNWTQYQFPWRITDIDAGMYIKNMQMIEVIRNNLSRIVPTDDLAYNEDGRAVSIFTGALAAQDGDNGKLRLSNAGFLKWIIDGLVSPINGSGTVLSSLTVNTFPMTPGSFSGVLSMNYNLSFALDWTRNLAAEATSARTERGVRFFESGIDVISNFFVANSRAAYIPNTGYNVEQILPLTYMLAATEQNTFFLAAIRETDKRLQETEIHYFNNCAVIIPYFDSYGRFDACVFENGAEYTLAQFEEKYRGNYVHLTRVRSSEDFYPR